MVEYSTDLEITNEDQLDDLRDFEDESIGEDSKEVIMQELEAFEQSNDNGVVNSMYWTELKTFAEAWTKHRKQASDAGIEWNYNPVPAMKANRFYTKAFGKRV